MDTRLCSRVGGLSCPSKIKIALWKFINQFVPTKLCLSNKRIANDTHSPRCHVANEDVSHVLRHCAFARNVWLAFHYGCPSNDVRMSFKDWLSWMFDRHPVRKRLEIAVILWALWNARNTLYHEGVIQGARDVVTFVHGYCSEL
ncbi:hypothetical protein J1N35_014529 [Gossypium stocksii]|uniref:Reverse transcriptase zinc-binding domain-containing protein n=1 Tax=Gossypium stocksii TaxID=47602 RepID=A0A9D4A7R0_9ROSI|nr:hypothetical protein J1N35_014529 [Gossypium stocksii]